VSPVDLGFNITPMEGRLRGAGTVELGGLSAALNPDRIALPERGVRKLFPNWFRSRRNGWAFARRFPTRCR
jgi:D-amino-acid dehydrogenase